MNRKNESLRDLAVFMQFGWVLALSLGALAYFGNKLDEKWETSPLFLLLGVFIALLASGWEFYRGLKNLQRRNKEDME